MKIALLIFLAMVVSAQQPADDPTKHPAGRVRGVVVDSVTRQLLHSAKVTIAKVQTITGEATLATDAAGAFEFDQLKPGPYHLTVVRHGYPAEKVVAVNAAENPASVTVELDPPASVSGQVVDEDGDGLAGCLVELRAVSRPKGASLNVTQDSAVIPVVANGHSSCERGEYRVFDILPGKYTAKAQCDAPGFQPRPLSAGPDPPPTVAWLTQFYPAAPDASSAEQIELAPGAERSAVNFRMRPAWITQVRGVLSMPSGFAGDGVLVMNLIPTNGQPQTIRPRPASAGTSGVPFEFLHVFPGSYELLVSFINLQSQDQHAGALQHIEVKDRPVNIAIALANGIDIRGDIDVESGSNRDQVHLDRANVRLTSTFPDFGPVDARVNPDGTFRLASVIPAQWHVAFHSDSVYVKSVWLGAKEVTGGLLDLSLNAGGAPDTLRILVSGHTATIHGTAPPEADIAACTRGQTA